MSKEWRNIPLHKKYFLLWRNKRLFCESTCTHINNLLMSKPFSGLGQQNGIYFNWVRVIKIGIIVIKHRAWCIIRGNDCIGNKFFVLVSWWRGRGKVKLSHRKYLIKIIWLRWQDGNIIIVRFNRESINFFNVFFWFCLMCAIVSLLVNNKLELTS